MKIEHKNLIQAFGFSICHIIEEDTGYIKFFQSMDDAFHQSFNIAKLDENTNCIKIFDNRNVLLDTLRLPK
ncbi:hypothetical protein [Clostridium rectalis]|uniref:hypothetical protein n=1 Tax=Clostridium rectalis TaxID=2040295 RepID=UPI000F640970|nr:hypothetical protein [Clostridium rectalis]